MIPNLAAKSWKGTNIGRKNVVDGNLGFSATQTPTTFQLLILVLFSNLVTKFGIIDFSYQCWFYTWRIMCYRLISAKPLHKLVLVYWWQGTKERFSERFESWWSHFHSRKCTGKFRLLNGGLFCLRLNELQILSLQISIPITNKFESDSTDSQWYQFQLLIAKDKTSPSSISSIPTGWPDAWKAKVLLKTSQHNVWSYFYSRNPL